MAGLLTEDILALAIPYLLVVSRIGGLFVFAPLLSSPIIPARVKALLALAMGAAVFPTIPIAEVAPATLDLYDLAPIVLTEMLIGASVGLFASIPMMSVQLGGLLMGQQMGLGIAQVLNPATNIEGDNIGQVLFLMTMISFVYVGGLETLYGAVAHTFGAVPLGAFTISAAPLDIVVGLMHTGFVMALSLSLPVLVIIFVESAAVGFIMKTIPSLNIMNFGFPLRILVGLIALVASLEAMRVVIDAELDRAATVILDWVTAL